MTDRQQKNHAATIEQNEQVAMEGKSSALPTKRHPKKWLSKKRALVLGIVIVLAVSALMIFTGGEDNTAMANSDLTEHTVGRGNISKTVSGPGSVQPVQIFTVATNLTGDIAEDFFEEGDEVKKDSLLYRLDEDSTSIDIDSVQSSYNTALDNYSDSLKDVADLTTYSDTNGIISNLYVREGEQVSGGAKIADVVDSQTMVVTLPFNSADAANIYSGAAATVYIENYGLTLEGTVSKVASGESISATGALITNVEIKFTNPGALQTGLYATALVNGYACNDEGLVSYAGENSIYASAAGKITGLYVDAGDSISSGQKILTVENDSITSALSKSQQSLEDAQKRLINTQDSLEITAPITGTVLAKSAKAGDTLYNTSTTLATIADMSRLTFTIEVDELDIRYMEVGQTALVTADAYEEEIYEGIVTNVGKTGTASGGVTTYAVTIEIEQYGDLLPGMNVNAEIIIESAEDVLLIPADAVVRGNMVLVKDGGSADAINNDADMMPENFAGMPEGPAGDAQTNSFFADSAPDGYSYRQVETGISDSDYVQILSGLAEGDVIGYTPSAGDDMGGFNMMMMDGGMGGAVTIRSEGGGPGGGF